MAYDSQLKTKQKTTFGREHLACLQLLNVDEIRTALVAVGVEGLVPSGPSSGLRKAAGESWENPSAQQALPRLPDVKAQQQGDEDPCGRKPGLEGSMDRDRDWAWSPTWCSQSWSNYWGSKV